MRGEQTSDKIAMLGLVISRQCNVYGKKSFLSKESDTLRSYRVYISPTM